MGKHFHTGPGVDEILAKVIESQDSADGVKMF